MPRADPGREPFSDDDLVEIQVDRIGGYADPEVLIVPSPSSSANSAFTRPGGNPRRRPQATATNPASMSRQTSSSTVIDLTEEPDSPVQQRRLPPPLALPGFPAPPPRRPIGRNPRRTGSVRPTPPRLSRSESIVMASQTSFIDLTGEDDMEPAQQRRSQRNNQAPSLHADPTFGWGRNVTRFTNMAAHAFGQQLLSILNPSGEDLPAFRLRTLGAGAPHFPMPRREPSKPPMEPVPAAREGFTRETCLDEDGLDDQIVVCPSCDEEMAYDPADAPSAPTTATGKKRKRAPGDHHFWALKKCGHVSTEHLYMNALSDHHNRSFVPTVLRTVGQPRHLRELLRFVQATNRASSSALLPGAQPEPPKRRSGLVSFSSQHGGCQAFTTCI